MRQCIGDAPIATDDDDHYQENNDHRSRIANDRVDQGILFAGPRCKCARCVVDGAGIRRLRRGQRFTDERGHTLGGGSFAPCRAMRVAWALLRTPSFLYSRLM